MIRDHSPEASLSQQKNVAAWQSPNAQSSAVTASDSKRNDTATLAQSLASSGSWADRVFASSTAPASGSASNNQSMGRLQTSEIPQTTAEPDPPPAYSPSEVREIHEMPATPVVDHATRVEGLGQANQGHSPSAYTSLSDVEQTERSPLLSHPSQPPRRFLLCGNRKEGFSRKQKALWLAAVIVVCMICLACALTSRWNLDDTYLGHPKPSDTPPRQYDQHEKYQNITGTFRLYDLLDLSTSFGHIDIDIEPMPGEAPAVMRLASKTGSIKVRMSPTMKMSKEQHVEQRQFDTSIHTTFGDISGQLLFGNGGLLNVSSVNTGSLHLEVLAVGVGPFDEESELLTTSTFGSQNITVVSVGGAQPVSNIRARHIAVGTGSVKVNYPSQWIGRVHVVAAGFGDVRVAGEDLIIESEDEWKVNAYRGSSPPKNATVKVKTGVTGTAWFTC